MSSPQYPQPQRRPSINDRLIPTEASDQYSTIVHNLLYPSRPSSHVPWAKPSVPLFITKTADTRYEMPFVFSDSSTGLANNVKRSFHAFFNEVAFRWMIFSLNLSKLLRKLKTVGEKLSVVRLPSRPSAAPANAI